MSVASSTYYDLTKVRDQSPGASDWAATDTNFETISRLFKAFEQHQHNGAGGLSRPALYTQPTAPTIAPQGTAGTTTYTYYIVTRRSGIDYISLVGTTNTGNATLTGTNYNRVTWTAVTGATSYDVIRLDGGNTQGAIATGLSSATLTFNDTGQTAADYIDPGEPIITEYTTGGILTPGTSLGVRLSYLNALGLETESSPEAGYMLSAGATSPLTPILVSTQVNTSPGLPGGDYIYAITKRKGTGETEISDVLPVSIFYDNTYSVTLQFNAINSYTDGTDGLNIYRSEGFDSSFQLITTVTTTSQTTYTDTNNIVAGNDNVQPPSTSTFDSNRKVRLDWSELSHPVGATSMRVYITQQTGIWTTNHLLTTIDLTGSPPTYIDYLGNEALDNGAPSNVSQIIQNPPLVNLATEATGAPSLSANMAFNNFQALTFRVENTSAPGTGQNGRIYYDTSTNNIRAYINGTWVNWGTSTTGSYTHPAEEVGGHVAANIKFTSGSAVTSKTVFDTMRNSDGTRKSIAKVVKSVGAAQINGFTTTTATQMTDMTVSITPDFVGQWLEAIFSGHFSGDTANMTISLGIQYNGTLEEETIRTVTIPFNNANVSIYTSYVIQEVATSADTINVFWWVAGGTATAVSTRRVLVAKELA